MILNSLVALVAVLFAFAPVFALESPVATVVIMVVCAAVAVLAVMSSGDRRYRAGVAVGGAVLALTAFVFAPTLPTLAGQLSVAYFFFAAGVAPTVRVQVPQAVEQPRSGIDQLRRAA